MVKCFGSAVALRRLVTLSAFAAVAFVAACSDDDPAWPSNAAVADMLIQKVPQGAPSLMIEAYGDTLRLLGVPMDANGTWVDAPVTWTSSRTQLADVSTMTGLDGRPYAVLRFAGNPSYANATHVDTVMVTATTGGTSTTLAVVVREDPRVDEVRVTSVTPFLVPGMSFELTADARDGFGNSIDAPNPWVWASSAPGVATVDDHEDGTATVTTVGEGSAIVSAAMLNAGEPEETGVVTGTSTITVPTQLTSGATITAPTINDDTRASWTVDVPANTSTLTVQISGGSGGDADLYVYSPGTVPTSTNFVCRPFLVGSNETCTIDNPAAGVWGIQVHAWPGDGDVAGLQITATVN